MNECVSAYKETKISLLATVCVSGVVG